jgi:DNA-binding MarR family transcriptional regulator/GNAT superfamily N-acetyltransferase
LVNYLGRVLRMATPDHVAPDQLDSVRRFGRFYTRHVGALAEGLLDSPHPLPEARLIFELGQAEATASALAERLGMDPGYMSRLVRRLDQAGLLARGDDAADARRQPLRLTDAGRTTFERLDAASRAQVAGWLAPLDATARDRLVGAMMAIEALLSGAAPTATLRPLGPGDLGWVIGAHGRIYAEEYGWDWTFEALVAGICQQFVAGFDPATSAGWIAELAGLPVGSVFVVPGPDEATAKLRMLILERAARGQGLGRRLVETAEDFARRSGRTRMVLWTHDVLQDARALYAGRGYRLTHAAPHHSFGQDLVEETWERAL